ncbi:hypothetical protein AVEN_63287-1 [Araneus ventricosus]|uniref:Uncharacterized protein n=1 Tax=Araneus ventricosus TaxID=182803 RepID=A0A4Y2J387_ARAVE|nr:hypothetical protein AVEN_63287-1 [Araneus ventricosus]
MQQSYGTAVFQNFIPDIYCILSPSCKMEHHRILLSLYNDCYAQHLGRTVFSVHPFHTHGFPDLSIWPYDFCLREFLKLKLYRNNQHHHQH